MAGNVLTYYIRLYYQSCEWVAQQTLAFRLYVTHLIGGYQKPHSKPKALLQVFDRLVTPDFRCVAEFGQNVLF